MRGHVLNLDVFNPRSSETHELCFLRSQHTDLYGFIPCAANALSIKPLSSSFLSRRASLKLIEVHSADFWILRFHPRRAPAVHGLRHRLHPERLLIPPSSLVLPHF